MVLKKLWQGPQRAPRASESLEIKTFKKYFYCRDISSGARATAHKTFQLITISITVISTGLHIAIVTTDAINIIARAINTVRSVAYEVGRLGTCLVIGIS